MEQLHFYRDHLLPDQRLVISFERMLFNNHTNMEYLLALLGALKSSAASFPRPTFDFVSKIYRIHDMTDVLQAVRDTLPDCTILYHHGEMTSAFSLLDRIQDAERLLPFV